MNKVAMHVLLKCDCSNHGNNIDLTNCINNSNEIIQN